MDGYAKLHLREGVIRVSDREGNSLEQTIPDLELLVVIGRGVLLTSAALLTLAQNNIPVVLIDPRAGTASTLFNPVQVGTIETRMKQYECIASESCRTAIVSKIIEAKLRGLYNLIAYEARKKPEFRTDWAQEARAEILASIEEARRATSIDELRTIEAEGSKAAWKALIRMFPNEYGFTGRKPRNGDTINSAIDYAYAVIYGIAAKALVAAGLDPYAGFMHTPRPGRHSLVYDFSEIYKPLAIHAILQASRITRLKTFRGSSRLTPKSLEAITKQLYYKLHTLGEKYYKRKNIWIHPIQEANKIKQVLTKQTIYKPYIYKPPA